MDIELSMCVPANHETYWENINWSQCFKQVRRLQVRIVKAWKAEKYNKAKSLQWILTKSFSAKALAVKRVTENTGGTTPGVDKLIWNT